MLGLNTWHSEIDNELEQQGLAAAIGIIEG